MFGYDSTTVPFRWATVSAVKMAFSAFRNGRKRVIGVRERNGAVVAGKVLLRYLFVLAGVCDLLLFKTTTHHSRHLCLLTINPATPRGTVAARGLGIEAEVEIFGIPLGWESAA